MAENKNKGANPPEDPQLELLKSISAGIANLSEEVRSTKDDVASLSGRVASIETGGKDDFKRGATEKDVASASENRKGADPRVVAIVDETLGTDFGIEMAPLDGDRIGNLFTLIVPERMNDDQVEKRPVRDETTGELKKDGQGNVLMEDFRRQDRRSKIISAADGYPAIREHCEKVRAYITAFYAANKKPMPQLKVK